MNRVLYSKRTAVVEEVARSQEGRPHGVLARYDDTGVIVWLRLRARLGWGHCGSRGFDFEPGTRIKVFQRPQDRSLHFRRTGS